jgi:hypothetical protein
MLPVLDGRPIRVCMHPSLGPHMAAVDVRKRIILLDSEVLHHRGDFERILIHELFHFAWVRLSNAQRRSWELLLAAEFTCKAQGELGWSAESRKNRLCVSDARRRSPSWRRYARESFCDTAAWRFAGLAAHEEFTLARPYRAPRRKWFIREIEQRSLPL